MHFEVQRRLTKEERQEDTQTRTHLPAVPPTAMAAPICAMSSGEGFNTPNVAAMPPATPIMPRVLPRRAVDWVERPARAPTQHNPDPKYIICTQEQQGLQEVRTHITQNPILDPINNIEAMRSHLLDVITALKSHPVTSNKQTSRQKIQVVVLRRISGALEHVQHPPSDQETT